MPHAREDAETAAWLRKMPRAVRSIVWGIAIAALGLGGAGGGFLTHWTGAAALGARLDDHDNKLVKIEQGISEIRANCVTPEDKAMIHDLAVKLDQTNQRIDNLMFVLAHNGKNQGN